MDVPASALTYPRVDGRTREWMDGLTDGGTLEQKRTHSRTRGRLTVRWTDGRTRGRTK